MENPMQFITGDLGSFQFYMFMLCAVLFWAGLLTGNFIISVVIVFVMSINTVIVKHIEAALIYFDVSHPDWVIDSMYLVIPSVAFAVLAVMARNTMLSDSSRASEPLGKPIKKLQG